MLEVWDFCVLISTMMDKRGYLLDLGQMDYGEAWELQHHLWSERVQGKLPDLLLLLEHSHVITLGRRGDRSHLLVAPDALKAMGVSLYHIERGGNVTYHGPGQLVAYPILDLKGYGYRVVQYIEQLEEVVLRVLKDFGIEGRRDTLNRGVWVNQEKIASVGVAIKRWVSFHGIALNYETDLKYFEMMDPCGLEGVEMTSMAKILGVRIQRKDLVNQFSFHFKEIFEREWEEKGLAEILSEHPMEPRNSVHGH